MKLHEVKTLEVNIHGRRVGTLAETSERTIAFKYHPSWLEDGFSVNPFSLPLEERAFVPKLEPFQGLFGVFSDSLPDGWGRLLVDRVMIKHRIDPRKTGSLKRLGIVGSSGMGALTYHPEVAFQNKEPLQDLDRIAEECKQILVSDYSEDLDELFMLGGSSGGARPKILTKVDGEEWIIKFPSSEDKANIGLMEYEYSLCAKKCGIEMTETKLFPSAKNEGYFGTKRFDRVVNDMGAVKRRHMISASGLLETSHRVPNLDYNLLMKLIMSLTKDYYEIEKLYRLMCFNVFAHNRDDHSKNFSFIYNEDERKWQLSPAYDLTFSYSIGGEHATTVNGNGVNPGEKELLAVASQIKLSERKAKDIIAEVRECVECDLGRWLYHK